MTQLDKSAHARNGASIEARMKVLGITLPTVATPAANYVTYVLEDGLLAISGQLPMENGAVAVKGKLGGGVSLEEGQRAAQLCALNLLAQANVALDGLGRIRRCVRLGRDARRRRLSQERARRQDRRRRGARMPDHAL